jgi:signal transduction histidine kinase
MLDRRMPRSRWLRAGAVAGEVSLLVLLLAMDFELGTRSMPSHPDTATIAGALATALVAVVVAALALLRRVLPPRATVSTILALSLCTSVVAVFTDHLSPSLTEIAAVLVAAVVGIRSELRPRGAIAVGGAALVVVLAAVLLRFEADVTAALLGVLVWGCAPAAGIAARYVRSKRESALVDARRAERMELARELHDVVAQQVSGMVVQAQAAITVAGKDPDRATEALSAIESAGSEALSGMRRMVATIRDEGEPDSSRTVQYGLDDIPTLVDRFDPGRERTTLSLRTTDGSLPAEVAESAYRIVREALTNVQSHAPGARTCVTVHEMAGDLHLAIRNDGVGEGDVAQEAAGYGLTGITERAAMLGGTLQAGPDGPGTWSVRASLPTGAAR